MCTTLSTHMTNRIKFEKWTIKHDSHELSDDNMVCRVQSVAYIYLNDTILYSLYRPTTPDSECLPDCLDAMEMELLCKGIKNV